MFKKSCFLSLCLFTSVVLSGGSKSEKYKSDPVVGKTVVNGINYDVIEHLGKKAKSKKSYLYFRPETNQWVKVLMAEVTFIRI